MVIARQTTIAHLTASPCFGGPERQMLELGKELADSCRSVYLSFLEEGRCWDFLNEAKRRGFASFALHRDTPRLLAALAELIALLESEQATVLCCHGYKAGILGRIAARRLRIPAVAVSRGWTGESACVRLFEILDRVNLRWMDRVVCVSEAQAVKVRRAGVPPERINVIRNAVRSDRFDNPQPDYRRRLERLFAQPPATIIGAAGRLSPEKGFDVLIAAAATVLRREASAGFVLFGEGKLRKSLSQAVHARGLQDKFVFAGFHADLDQYLSQFDLLVLSSYNEGLPNVVLESLAAGVPAVATAVGGTPEVLEDGVSGYLVPSGDAGALAGRILEMLADHQRRRAMGQAGQCRVRREFSFHAQAKSYLQLLQELICDI